MVSPEMGLGKIVAQSVMPSTFRQAKMINGNDLFFNSWIYFAI